jgi:crotonobetainyl-CoA:carnitine CoA-transferase CaiB-like acyl-CoA transferase
MSESGPVAGRQGRFLLDAQAGTVPYMLMADLGADVIKIEVPTAATARGA